MTLNYFTRVILTPTAVFLSVLFGASYGSGREVVEFVSSNGPTGGLVAILVLITAHVVVLALSFELARMFRAYDYVSFFKILLKKGWFLYEIVIIVGLVVALSITATVGGTVIGDKFEINAWVGTGGIFLLVVALTYYGRQAVQRSMMLSIIALFVVLVILVYQVTGSHSETIVSAFQSESHNWNGLSTGLIYAIGGGGYLPLLLYCAAGLRNRREVGTAAVSAAVIAAIPATIFHVSFMAGYPTILDEKIPTYWLLQHVSTPTMLNIYVLVMFVLVAQTGVGVLQGLIERVDLFWKQKYGHDLPAWGHSSLAGAIFVICTAASTMGITALILRGYTIMFTSFIVVFIIPLITYGLYLVVQKGKS